MSIDQIEYIKISPGIGMARVGNSETDFIGPETPGIPPNPTGGFKDIQGKVKPMSSRFRVYGYNAAGEAVMELNLNTPGVTSLEWTVHMANKKAANYAFQGKFGFNSKVLRNPGVQPKLTPDERDQLIIDPGPVPISGSNTARKAMTGTIFDGITNPVPIPTSNIMENYGKKGTTDVTYSSKEVTIGWLRTDADGRLVIVGGRGDADSLTTPPTIIQKGPGVYNAAGGLNTDPNSNGNLYFNNPGWYDDTGGGSVNATVVFTNSSRHTLTLKTTGPQTLSNGNIIEEKFRRAWVAVAPPKFVPSMANVVSLADLQYNIFPEADPNAGSLFVAVGAAPNGPISLYDSKSGSSIAQPTAQTTENAKFNPALVTFNSSLYCAFNSSETATANRIILATSDDPGGTASYTYYEQSADVLSDCGPALTVFNGEVLCAVLANESSASQFKNKVVLGHTTRTTFTFNALSFKCATSKGLKDFVGLPTQPVAISAYNGNLYLAMTVSGKNYLGVPSTKTAHQFNMQEVGQKDIVNKLAPSLAAYDGRLYYAITDFSGVAKYASLDLNGPQIPLYSGTPDDTTPAFNLQFAAVDGAVSSTLAPAIAGFNGKLYCLVVDSSGDSAMNGHLYTKTPLMHINKKKVADGPVIEEEPPFIAVTTLGCGTVQPALTVFETVDFYRDILPVLKTVTDYAYVNELAFDGHGPSSQANFVRPPYLASIANPDIPNSRTRKHVFQFIRPGEWVTEVPPPPKDFLNSIIPPPPPKDPPILTIIKKYKSIVPSQENQQGTLMPHLAGTGGSAAENIFNSTKFPGQWLSLTRHQLAKFQKWVNGQFVTGSPLPAPIPVDLLPLEEQPSALDFAAFELTVGGGFHPGIELTYYMAYPEYFCEPFRFTDEIVYGEVTLAQVTPGSIAGYMSIPWHGDFWSCNTDFWPPQRPDIVVQDVEGVPTPVNWFRSSSLQIPETASSDTKWLHGDNPNHFDGNNTSYQTFLKYWSYFGFVTTDNSADKGEQARVETERADCLDGPSPSLCRPLESDLVDFYRLYNGTDHFYTIYASERDSAEKKYGYHSEGIACYVFSSQVNESIPLYRLNNGTDHFYTTSATERDKAETQGYTSEGIACYVFSSQINDSSPLYRLYNGEDHFYTTSAAERDNAETHGYTSEGIACYVIE
jgi:L-lysine epsilon oxidase-like protein/uncharacterized protein DUF5648